MGKCCDVDCIEREMISSWNFDMSVLYAFVWCIVCEYGPHVRDCHHSPPSHKDTSLNDYGMFSGAKYDYIPFSRRVQ